MKKIAIIGCGFLGNIIADAMKKGLLADYALAGAMSHQKASAEKLCEGLGGEAVETLDELLALNPDMVIETASVAMVREACIPTLEHGADFIPLSIGACCVLPESAGGCTCAWRTHLHPARCGRRLRCAADHRADGGGR